MPNKYSLYLKMSYFLCSIGSVAGVEIDIYSWPSGWTDETLANVSVLVCQPHGWDGIINLWLKGKFETYAESSRPSLKQAQGVFNSENMVLELAKYCLLKTSLFRSIVAAIVNWNWCSEGTDLLFIRFLIRPYKRRKGLPFALIALTHSQYRTIIFYCFALTFFLIGSLLGASIVSRSQNSELFPFQISWKRWALFTK
jgi:uncharacterized membrane protein